MADEQIPDPDEPTEAQEASGPDAPSAEAEGDAPEETSDETADEAPDGTADDEAEAPVIDPDHEPILARLAEHLGDGIVAAVSNHGVLTVRVEPGAWHQAAEVAKTRLDCEYLSFISGIDWMPRPIAPTEDPSAPSIPAQPQDMTFGVTGSAGRFQVLACVESTDDHIQIVFKTDVAEDDPRIASWVDLYPGADWHERECWEMFGFRFDGHPHLRHLYLPGEFEGHPLRKDYPLLAREVKPWPGLVDVELMPDEGGDSEPAEATAGGDES